MLQVLIEAGQRLPDGRLRQRGLPLSEKMIGQEEWQTAAVRAVSEELATALPQDWRQQVRLYVCACYCCLLAGVQYMFLDSSQEGSRAGGIKVQVWGFAGRSTGCVVPAGFQLQLADHGTAAATAWSRLFVAPALLTWHLRYWLPFCCSCALRSPATTRW
jgi:hypothetical protein